MMKKIIFLVAILVLIFIAMLFYVLKDKVKNVSDEMPYKAMIGKTLFVKREMKLVENLPEFTFKYKNTITEDETLFEGVKHIRNIPEGTMINVQKVYKVTGGTSGTTHVYVVGKEFSGLFKAGEFYEYLWEEKKPFFAE